MWNNYCKGMKNTIFQRYTNFSQNRARLLRNKIHQAEQEEVRIQMKRSAIHQTCDDEECVEGRSKEIGHNSQEGATSRCINRADIYRPRGNFLNFFKNFQSASGPISTKMPSKRSKGYVRRSDRYGSLCSQDVASDHESTGNIHSKVALVHQ